MLVRVADHVRDARKRGDLFGSALGVTPRDNNFCQRILALDAADSGTGILIGGIRNCTGVQNYEIGLRGGRRGQAPGFELARQGGAIGLSGAASEVFDVVGGHGTMLAQVR